jgi:hypothetical protein
MRRLFGGTLPFPTTLRAVSGTKMKYTANNTAAQMVRNQKMDRHPRYSVNNPPMTGASTGPKLTPRDAYAMNRPLSARVTMSATAPAASATVAEDPVDCRHRNTIRAG